MITGDSDASKKFYRTVIISYLHIIHIATFLPFKAYRIWIIN